MKFTVAFAVLATLVAQSVVSAAPLGSDSDAVSLDARAEFIESALEEVWSRFYDELDDVLEARGQTISRAVSEHGATVGQAAFDGAQKASASLKHQADRVKMQQGAILRMKYMNEAKKKVAAGKKRDLGDLEDLEGRGQSMSRAAAEHGSTVAQAAYGGTQKASASLKHQADRVKMQQGAILRMKAMNDAKKKTAAGKKRDLGDPEDLEVRGQSMSRAAAEHGPTVAQAAYGGTQKASASLRAQAEKVKMQQNALRTMKLANEAKKKSQRK